MQSSVCFQGFNVNSYNEFIRIERRGRAAFWDLTRSKVTVMKRDELARLLESVIGLSSIIIFAQFARCVCIITNARECKVRVECFVIKLR